MRDKWVVSENPFTLTFCPDRYIKPQKMCDKAVDGCLAALKFISDSFVTSKMLERFHGPLLAPYDMLFYDEIF